MRENITHTLHWVQGNTVNFAIPLQQETQTPQGKVVEDYYPAVDDVVTVSMCGKYLSTQIPCTVDGNVVIANDNGTLKVDVYGVEIRIKKADGTNLRSMWDTQVQIHKTNDGVLTEWDDFVAPDSQSLDAAIFFFAKGDKGDKGDQGIRGEKGEQGEKGEKGDKGDAGTTDYNELENKPDLSIYQEKEQGKGLSENDYTDEEKQLVHSAVQQESDPTVPQWAKQPNKPTYTAQDVGALPNSTKYGSTIDLAMDSATYVLTLSLKDQDGTVLNTKTVDLPIESVVVNGRYDAANKKIVLTLQSGSTIDVPVGDLIAGLQTEITSVNMLDADLVDDTNSTHKFVTAQEKQTWNNKSDFSGSYNDLTDKPTIPTTLSQLSEDTTHRTVSDAEKTAWGNKQETLVSGTNIKTINNESILGGGNIAITGEVYVIDNTPQANSNHLVSSGGVASEIVWDVTARNSNATFASLSALLSDASLDTLIPTTIRRGGMQIRFVCSSDNKYVQARLMADEWSIDANDWSISDDTILTFNPNFLKVYTDSENKIIWAIKNDGTIFYGAGCPPQVKELLDEKVDKVEGKGLSTNDYDNTAKELVDTYELVENTDFIELVVDSEYKILKGTKTDGTQYIGVGLQVNGDIENETAKIEGTNDIEFCELKIDNVGKIIEGITKKGEKRVEVFDKKTKEHIRTTCNNSFVIGQLDADFNSPVPVVVTGTKGDENAKYEFELPLSSKAFNIRFKFLITENILNQNKTAVIAKFQNSPAVTAKGVSLTQRTTTATYQSEQKTNYWPCLTGGVRLNNSIVAYDFESHNIGLGSFSIKYAGEEDSATIENTGEAFVLKIGENTHTLLYSQYPSVSELYEALKEINDIQVDYREIEGHNCSELATFSECKLKSVMYTGITGANDAPIVEYTDASDFIIPYAVSDKWHNVEIIKIGDSIYCSCDGKLITLTMNYSEPTTLTLGGECGVLFKEFEVHTDSCYDAEIVDGLIISSMNPYIIIYEGHGIDKVPSVEAETTGNMSTTIDRLQSVFSTLKDRGYVPVSIYDIADYYDGKKTLPKRCYTLIFDDLRFNNVLDIDNRSVFTKFGVEPSLALITNSIDNIEITLNGEQITPAQAAMISKLHSFALISHTRNHRDNSNVKPSELKENLIQDNYSGDIHDVDGSVLVFPFGATSPYLFSLMEWLGYRLGINVYLGNYNTTNKYIMNKYNLIRYEIGMRTTYSNILSGIK